MHPPDRFTCEEVFARLDDYVDRELTPEEAAMMRAHLDTCAVCAGEYRFESTVLEGVRRKLERLPVPPDLMQRISARIAKDTEQERRG